MIRGPAAKRRNRNQTDAQTGKPIGVRIAKNSVRFISLLRTKAKLHFPPVFLFRHIGIYTYARDGGGRKPRARPKRWRHRWHCYCSRPRHLLKKTILTILKIHNLVRVPRQKKIARSRVRARTLQHPHLNAIFLRRFSILNFNDDTASTAHVRTQTYRARNARIA